MRHIRSWTATVIVAAMVFVLPPAASAQHAGLADGRLPAGFTEQKVRVGDIGINYVRGGHGPVVVLLHGYPETWYEWHEIMPALAARYTVVAPDLPGAGKSDAPAGGYDKKTMAADIHGLLVELGLNRSVRLVGHDIGSMVAYAYAAAHPGEVTKLVLSEAPIPDETIYAFPSLSATGPLAVRLLLPDNGLPEKTVEGREEQWVGGFIDQLEVVKGGVSADDVRVFAHYLQDDAHLRANFAWFRAFPTDINDDKADKRTKLPMPVLAVGADHSLGTAVGTQVKGYATHVTPVVIAGSGHWIYE